MFSSLLSKVGVTFLAIQQAYADGTSAASVLIAPTSDYMRDDTYVMSHEDDSRLALIVTSIDVEFFQGIRRGATTAKLQGFAVLKIGSGPREDASFHVDLNLASLPSALPTSAPSSTARPSAFPTSAPSSLLAGLPKHVELWGELSCILHLSSRALSFSARGFQEDAALTLHML